MPMPGTTRRTAGPFEHVLEERRQDSGASVPVERRQQILTIPSARASCRVSRCQALRPRSTSLRHHQPRPRQFKAHLLRHSLRRSRLLSPASRQPPPHHSRAHSPLPRPPRSEDDAAPDRRGVQADRPDDAYGAHVGGCDPGVPLHAAGRGYREGVRSPHARGRWSGSEGHVAGDHGVGPSTSHLQARSRARRREFSCFCAGQ